MIRVVPRIFVCGGKLYTPSQGSRIQISDQHSYKKEPSKLKLYVRKNTFSFPGGGKCLSDQAHCVLQNSTYPSTQSDLVHSLVVLALSLSQSQPPYQQWLFVWSSLYMKSPTATPLPLSFTARDKVIDKFKKTKKV